MYSFYAIFGHWGQTLVKIMSFFADIYFLHFGQSNSLNIWDWHLKLICFDNNHVAKLQDTPALILVMWPILSKCYIYGSLWNTFLFLKTYNETSTYFSWNGRTELSWYSCLVTWFLLKRTKVMRILVKNSHIYIYLYQQIKERPKKIAHYILTNIIDT